MLFKKVCPRCASLLSKKDDVCPECGYSFASEKQTEEAKVLKFENITEDNSKEVSNANLNVNNEEEAKATALSGNNETEALPQEKQNYDAGNNDIGESENTEETIAPKRHKHKKKNRNQKISVDVEIEQNGEYNIDTRDVTFFEGASDSYSSKEKKKDKPKWWEIYKWADIYFARRKINKEVNKAAVEIPPYVNKGVMLILCLLFGWMGAHNYYAKNYKKGVLITIAILIALPVANIKALEGIIQISVGGGFGFIVLFAWVWDLISIIINKYKYRESKLKFISKLNAKTREKLGTKYLNIHDWFVPYEEKKNTQKLKRAKIKRVR
ncbi:MAG: NINE protein [Clostridia bacterium]|nr:NINE protein [Clostridia bacterium]